MTSVVTEWRLLLHNVQDKPLDFLRAPVRSGIPIPSGRVSDVWCIRVVDGHDARQTVQRKVLGRWPDDSIRWCVIEFIWDSSEGYHVVFGDAESESSPTSESTPLIKLSGSDDAAASKASGLTIQCQGLDQTVRLEIRLRHEGTDYRGVIRPLQSRDAGPVRWSNEWAVRFDAENKSSPLVGRLIANSFADFSVVNFDFMIRNPQPMDHPGGNWDLGATGSVQIDDLSFHFSLPTNEHSGDQLSVDLSDTGSTIEANQELSVFQASSGGENWNSGNHVDRHGNIPLKFRGYKVAADGFEHSGLRAEPVARSVRNGIEYSIGYRDFWQNFPKTLAADSQGLRIGLFPAEAGGAELQGGEQKTHRFAFEMKAANSPSYLEAVLNPPLIKIAPEEYSHAEALPYLVPKSETCDQRYNSLVNQAIEGDDTFAIKAEKIDQFGWRNFGDLYGDHEAVFHQGDSPLISHYNNQYDCVLGFGIQFLRTGNRQWFDLMTQMADHAWDIDTYHTDQDKLLYNGGLFWHTYHYADAHTSTHRSYPKRLRVSQSFEGGQDLAELGATGEKLARNYAIGGGPAASQNYSTGWMLAYWLTGEDRYRTAALNAAEYVLRIEDGRNTPFKWLCRGDTGYSTCSSEGYYGPGRASANSTHALLTGHELTGEERFLKRAAFLMRRTVHPAQDLEALDLLNAELRWFYTMYLQSLGRFVDYKDLLGQRDEDFEYGVAVLLHYTDWMVKHERPTLDAADQLQYPTETWAAQDMRKWHVLEHAAQYQCDPEKRQQLYQKADFFFNDVCDSLSKFETRSLCRPVVLMLNFGWQRDWFLAHRDQLRLSNVIDREFGKPQRFLPQRQIAIRRFKRLIVLGVVGVMLVAMGIAVSIWSS